MNIVIGKIGKSLKWNPSSWGAIGGDNEGPLFFEMLAKHYPEYTFWIIGRTDWSRLKPEMKQSIAPHGNIIDIWEGFKTDKGDPLKTIEYPIHRLSNVKIDGGIFYSGPVCGINIPHKIKKEKDGTIVEKVLMCFSNYAAPVIHYLNSTGIKYITLGPDPRYIPLHAQDLWNRESTILSQFNGKGVVKHIRNYDDQSRVNTTIQFKYSGIEKVFLLDKDSNPQIPKKKTKFLMVLNEGGNGAPKRGPELKRWVLDHFPDVQVYGKWADSWYDDSRFKGPLKFMDLQKKLWDVKYTLCIPIDKGWVTAKFWEMLYYGIIPFLHPNYDTQNHLPVPDFIRVKSPEDLRKKIQVLEENPDMYTKLQNKLREILEPSDFTGERLTKTVMDELHYVIGKDS